MLNVKNTLTFSTAFSLLILLCFSCNFSQKKSLKQKILQIDYYVRYLQTDKQVKAIIGFTEIDSTQKRTPKMMEEVLLEKHTLSGKKVGNQYRYQLTKEIPFAENYELTYRLNREETITQTINIYPIIDFTIKKGKVSKKMGTNLIFEGMPLATNEALVLLLSDKDGQTATFKITNQRKNSIITIPAEKVNHLAVGKGTMYMVRKQTTQTQSAATELVGLTEYYSTVRTIEIID